MFVAINTLVQWFNMESKIMAMARTPFAHLQLRILGHVDGCQQVFPLLVTMRMVLETKSLYLPFQIHARQAKRHLHCTIAHLDGDFYNVIQVLRM
jgi:hypothetical protein